MPRRSPRSLTSGSTSYKRLVPGYEAPVYISWARRNRSALVRVPMYKPGKEKATRMEYRSPDPACNPYLAFSVMLAAGLKGIEKGYELSSPVEEDIFEMSEAARKKQGSTLFQEIYSKRFNSQKKVSWSGKHWEITSSRSLLRTRKSNGINIEPMSPNLNWRNISPFYDSTKVIIFNESVG